MIALRLRSGRRRKAENGGYASGSPPYGWRAVGRELIEDGREQTALRRMRELRADGCSYREIATALQDEGHSPKRGTVWYPMTIRQGLNR